MDFKKLLSTFNMLEGAMKGAEKHSTGPEFTGYWKGTDKGTPGKKMVGGSEQQESILKDLSKGPKPKTKEQELAEQYAAFMQALEEEKLGIENKRPARQGSRPAREYTKNDQPSKRYHYEKEEVAEDTQRLQVGDPIVVVGPNQFEGKTGEIAEFSPSGKFVVINLYNHGKHSMHLSDVEYNDYADSDEEEADMYDRDEDFRDWTSTQDVAEAKEKFEYKVECDGYDKGNFVNKDDAIASAQKMIYGGEKEYTKIEVKNLDSGDVIWQWKGKKDIDEEKDVPVISKFRRAMEKIANSDMSPQAKQAAFDRLSSEFHKHAKAYSEKVKGKQKVDEADHVDTVTVDIPLMIRLLEYAREDAKTDMDLHNVAERLIELGLNGQTLSMDQYNEIVPSQMDEAGANNPVQGAANQTVGQQQGQIAPTDQAKAAAQATQTLKSVTQTAAPAPKLGQAIAATTTGKAVAPNDMKVLQPLMKDVATIAQDPKLVNQFKSLANQANQAQKKQQAQLQQQAQQGGAE